MLSQRSDEETRVVAHALEEFARTPVDQTPLPDPSFIWWKAQLLRRRDAEREATAPIEVGNRIHIGAAVLGAAALAAGAWDGVPAIGWTPGTGLPVLAAIVILLSIVAAAAVEALRER